MSGIYLHIPFCASRCHYCDFFKSTRRSYLPLFVDKLVREIETRASLFSGKVVETIYFGGGTPSLLSKNDFERILNSIIQNFSLNPQTEFTIEVNPDDLSPGYLSVLRQLGFNRLSIGIQSFFNEDLKKMGRRHDGAQSQRALEMAFESHFQDVSVDLIYGLPWGNRKNIETNLFTLTSLPITHISAYHLSIEPETRFGVQKKKGLITEIGDEESEALFWIVNDQLEAGGFEHYEISNFCRDGKYSRHNTSYWKGQLYLGLGPGAHSFDRNQRFWNRPDLKAYLTQDFSQIQESELLTSKDHFNERVMLGLRTKWGIDEKDLHGQFPDYHKMMEPVIDKWINSGHLKRSGSSIVCTRKGWFVVDGIIEDLFLI